MSQFTLTLRFGLVRGACAMFAALLFAAAPARAYVSLQSPGGSLGQVQLSPHVYLVCWNLTSSNDPANQLVRISFFLNRVPGSRWCGAFTEYGGTGFDPVMGRYVISQPQNQFSMYQATWTDTGQQTVTGFPYQPPPADVAEAPNSSDPNGIYSDPNAWGTGVANEAIRAANYFGVQNDPNAIIIVFTPPRKYPLNPTVKGEALHGWVNAGGSLPTSYIDLRYLGSLNTSTGAYVFPAPDLGDPAGQANISQILEHELTEAVTDPRIGTASAGWRDPSFDQTQLGGEVADLEGLLGGDLAPNQDGTGVLQFKSQMNTFGRESTVLSLAPIWSNTMAHAMAATYGSQPSTQDIGAARWAFSNNIDAGDETFTPARFSIAPSGHLQFLGLDNSDGSVAWTDWGVPAGITGSLSYPVVTSWIHGRLDVFAFATVSSVQHLFHNSTDNRGGALNGWEDWGTLPSGNTFLANQSIAVTSYGPAEIDLYATSSSGQLWGRRRSFEANGTWADSGWVNLGAPSSGIASGPGAVAWISNFVPHVRVYVVNKSGKLTFTQFDSWNNPSAQPWVAENLSTSPTLKAVNPAVANLTAPRTFDVVALDTSGNVWHRAHCDPIEYIDDASSAEVPPAEYWENWGHPAGGQVAQPPAIASLATRQVLVDVRGSDGNVYELEHEMVGLIKVTGGFWVNQHGGPTGKGVTLVDD